MSNEKAENDVEGDDALADSRATGGVESDNDATDKEQSSTTSPTEDAEYVGRVAGDDAGDVGESGAEARAEAD